MGCFLDCNGRGRDLPRRGSPCHSFTSDRRGSEPPCVMRSHVLRSGSCPRVVGETRDPRGSQRGCSHRCCGAGEKQSLPNPRCPALACCASIL
eukprot:162044-Prymnesium_polylepis.1